MNYYEAKKEVAWHLEQLKIFKSSEVFLQSETFKSDGQQAHIWLRRPDGLAMSIDAKEKWPNAVMPWEDWKKDNWSEKEEFKYNTWVKTQKKQFKETPEYKNSKLAELVCCPLEYGSELPHKDGIEVYENGTIELCTGENFKNAVTAFNDFNMDNFYEDKKKQDWRNQQVALFKNSEDFKQSKSFKIEGQRALVLLMGDKGNVVMDAASPVEKFPNGIMSWEDWKKTNYSEAEEFKYNKLVAERREEFEKTDKFMPKDSLQEEQSLCMRM